MKYKHIKKHIEEVLFELRYRCRGYSLSEKISYYLFSIKWLWKNRHWQNNRKKFNALHRAYWG